MMSAHQSSKPSISIVIPCYNSKKTIRACLDSIVCQKTSLIYEIIVVDSSNDDTSNIVKKYVPGVKHIRLNKRTYCGGARNIGITNTKSDIIAFVDTDVVIDEDWVNNIYVANKKYDLVGSRVLNGNPHKLLGWSTFFLQFGAYSSKKSRIIHFFPPCAMSFKRTIFKRYGYFNEGPALNEDLIFESKIKEPIFLAHRAIARHINRTGLSEVLRYAFRLGHSHALALKETNKLQYLVKYKFLIPLLFFYRLFLIFYRSIHANMFGYFILTFPILISTLLSWNIGFFKGVWE